MIKKTIAFILSMALLLSVAEFTVVADAQELTEKIPVKFTVSSAFGETGDTTKVFIDVGENSLMSAAVFKLHFDTSMLRAKNLAIGTVLQDGFSSKNISETGEVLVSYAHTLPAYNAGRLFELEFEIIGQVPESEILMEIPVTLEVVELMGYDYTEIVPVVDNGFVAIVNTAYGDVNEDDLVAPSDTLKILNYAVNLDELSDPQKIKADVNGDGKINAVDAMYILRYTAGVISTYPIFELSAPENLAVVSKDETFIELKWDAVEYACGYNLYLNGEKVNDSPITETEYIVDSLEQDTQYAFSVAAVNTLKESEKSNNLSISTNKADRYVTFVDYDGSVIDSQIVLSGTDAQSPAEPTRYGYTFTGWDKPLNNIIEDTVFTAQYVINKYTATFQSNGGSEVGFQTKNYGALLDEPATPTRADYTFMGWYTDSAFVNQWDFATDTLSGNITLYAKWATWTEWTTDSSLKNDPNYIVESKVQYNYRDKSTTTSTSPSLSGWTQNGSYVTYGAWADAGWTASKPATSNTLQITNTRTVTDAAAYTKYNYYYYRYWYDAAGSYYYTYHGDYGGDYRTYTTTSPLPYMGMASGRESYGPTSIYYGYEVWFLQSTEYVPEVTHTEWFYQTRTATTHYNYYKWSAWSGWGDSAVGANENREVRTRTVYRYKPVQK